VFERRIVRVGLDGRYIAEVENSVEKLRTYVGRTFHDLQRVFCSDAIATGTSPSLLLDDLRVCWST
jgi:hypothetical protein